MSWKLEVYVQFSNISKWSDYVITRSLGKRLTCESNDLEEKATWAGRKQVPTSGSFKKQTPGVLKAEIEPALPSIVLSLALGHHHRLLKNLSIQEVEPCRNNYNFIVTLLPLIFLSSPCACLLPPLWCCCEWMTIVLFSHLEKVW